MKNASETLLAGWEPERYEFRALPMHEFALGRREFFKIFGAGLAVFAMVKDVGARQETAPGPHGFHNEELPKEIGAWLHIGENGTVTGFAGKAEIGQNVRTSLAQTIADELGVPLDSVRMVLADTALTPFDAGTFGSRTTPTMTPQLRRVAAAAREMLVEKASKQWKVPAEKLVAGEGKVSDPASGKSLRYAEIAHDLGKEMPPAQDPVKPASQWTIAGQPIPKADARAFVTGEHCYTTDLRPEGTLYGKVLRPPSFGATLVSYDDSAIKAMTDVVLVRDGDFVAAAAPTAAAAEAALAKVRVEWKEVPQIGDAEIFSYLKKTVEPSQEERFRKSQGSIAEGLAASAQKLETTYTVAYIAHAPLEPRAAVAQWTNGKLTVWMGTQRPFAVRDDLADIFHVSEKNVRVIVPDTGSAYGGKHTSDAGLEAARLAREAGGRPVKVVWTREEEFTWAYFRPAGVIEVRGGVGADGKLTAWEFHNYHSGTSAIETPYVAANQLTQYHQAPLVLRCGSYRGLAATANHFARETHMDSLARLASLDPLQFRLANLKDARMRAVLETGAKVFGWPRQKTEEGQGFGVAAGYEKGSYVATFAEISVDRKAGEMRVKKLLEVFECGAIVNPDGLRNQVIGAMIQGLGGALFESIQFQNGRIRNAHFASYRVPRFRDVPEIETILLDRKDIPSAGAGETPIMAVAPAIGNAFYDATKVRLTSLPLRPELHVAG